MVQLFGSSELTNVNRNIDRCFRLKACHSHQGLCKQTWKDSQRQKETLIRFESNLNPKYSIDLIKRALREQKKYNV